MNFILRVTSRKSIKLLQSLTLIFSINPLTPSFAEPLIINTGWTPPVSTLLEKIISTTFKRAGIDMTFHQLPAERSLSLVSQGVDDGDCCRIPKAIAGDYPQLLRVPEVVYTAKFSAFAKKPYPVIENFSSLKPYSTATIAGWKVLVNNIKKVNPEILHIMDNPESMFRILQKNRIDVATFGYLSGLQTISKLGLTDISVLEPPLATAPLYLYLHKKNKELIPVLTQVLRGMKKDGTLDRIIIQSSQM